MVRQTSLGYSGLIAIGVVLVQPFLTAASLDLSATICIAAFSVAIPLLAALILVNRQEAFRRRRTKSALVTIAQVVAQVCAFIGVVAGFWHILWIAGVGVLTAGFAGVAVHSAGYARLERAQEPSRALVPHPRPLPDNGGRTQNCRAPGAAGRGAPTRQGVTPPGQGRRT